MNEVAEEEALFQVSSSGSSRDGEGRHERSVVRHHFDITTTEVETKASSAVQGKNLPSFANAVNREINRRVQDKKIKLETATQELLDLQDRLQKLSEHVVNVEQEVGRAAGILEARKREAATEQHMLLLAKRQRGTVASEMARLTKLAEGGKEQATKLQAEISQGRKWVEALQARYKWSEEQLQRWQEAAKRKEVRECDGLAAPLSAG